jgi:hypothetical protein
MRIGVLVEGAQTEKQVYSSWLPALFPKITKVDQPEHAADNSFWIISGNGQPQIFDRIDSFVEDCADNSFDAVWIMVDSEGDSPQALKQQIQKPLHRIKVEVIIQNCCIETWGLGSKQLLGTASTHPELLSFRKHFDVFTNDPELCPPLNNKTVGATHFEYLKAAFRGKNASYSKSNAGEFCKVSFLKHLVTRASDGSNHISSFAEFLSVAKAYGAIIP